jgi:hypothetical protein
MCSFAQHNSKHDLTHAFLKRIVVVDNKILSSCARKETLFNFILVPTASEEPRVKKLLIQHVETVHHSGAVEDVLHSLLVIIH